MSSESDSDGPPDPWAGSQRVHLRERGRGDRRVRRTVRHDKYGVWALKLLANTGEYPNVSEAIREAVDDLLESAPDIFFVRPVNSTCPKCDLPAAGGLKRDDADGTLAYCVRDHTWMVTGDGR